MAGPRIDVLLPVRGARRTLPWALGDLLGQRDVRVRVLAVVDRAEPDDGSATWLEQRARDEPRLVVLSGPGRGPGPALDLGLAAVRSDLVAHMEADDRCPPDRLARLAAGMAARPELAGLTSRAGQLGARTQGMARYLRWQNGLLTHEQMARERFVEIPALHQTGLYRADALREVGGFTPRGPWPLDLDFWFRWFEHDLPVAKLPRVLYRWRQHPAQSTRSDADHDQAVLRAAKADALARLHGRDGIDPRPVTLVSTGRTLAAWRQALTAVGIELHDALEWKPGHPAPALPPDRGLLLAAYGMPSARERLRSALGNPAEPQPLRFIA